MSSEPGALYAQPAERVRILVVDDSPTSRELIVLILSRAGCVVESAASATDALAILADRAFDMVLSDLWLGGAVGGLHLAREVRRSWPRTGFILATGSESGVPAGGFKAFGVNAVLHKPFTPADLRRAVNLLVASGFGDRGRR
ncbi:MAG: response regulator [Chloroflexi bacterium]|nr:response regulator [Chloroflexota bacterium]